MKTFFCINEIKDVYSKCMIKKLKEKYFSHEGVLFRYALSYCLLMALLPTVMMFFVFYHDLSFVVSFLYQFIPQAFLNEYLQYLSTYQNNNIISLIVTFLVANYIASKVFYSFMLLSMKDEDDHLSLIMIRIRSFFAYFFFVICLLGIFILFQLFQLTSLTAVLLFMVFYLFYHLLNHKKKKWTYGIVGALFVSLSLIVMGYLFLWYVDHFTSYEKLYGSFAMLVVVYLSMYMISCIIYFGYCLNIILDSLHQDIF